MSKETYRRYQEKKRTIKNEASRRWLTKKMLLDLLPVFYSNIKSAGEGEVKGTGASKQQT